MKILVKNANIITLDGDKVIENGYLGTQDKKILFVSEKLPLDYQADYEIDAKGNTLMPGLCNAHSHVAMTILRSYSEGYKLQEWLTEKIFPIEDRLTEEDIYYGTLLGIAEMIRTGTTLVNDCYYFMDKAADAYIETGFNANISRGLMNSEKKDSYSDDYRIMEALSLFNRYNNCENDLIRVELFPHAVYTCSREYLTYIAKIAKEQNIPIASHLSENDEEVEGCIQNYGETPVEVYRDAGLLFKTANLAHCVCLKDSDIPLLKGHFITHNPTSNLKLGSGIADILKYKNNGINIALGTDGASSNNNLNMFEEMHIAALLMSGINKDASVVKPIDILKMATVSGAQAMGRTTKGILKEDYDADFILVDTNEVYHYPKHNIINNIVYTAQATDVVLTVANGKILYENGEYNTLDIELIKNKILNIKERLF